MIIDEQTRDDLYLVMVFVGMMVIVIGVFYYAC